MLIRQTAIIALLVLTCVAQAQEDPYSQALAYKFGDSRQALMKVEAEIRSARIDQRAAIETRLLAALNNPAATIDCRGWVCRQLRHVGSERSIPHLVKLLADKDLATPARIALQSLPGSDAALREALPRLEGDFKAGVVLTLGARGDVQSLPLIAPLASDASVNVAEAAIYALGQFATPEALDALRKARVADSLKRQQEDAILRCADALVSQKKLAEAAALYAAVLKSSDHPAIQTAAMDGLFLSDSHAATKAVYASVFDNPDPRMARELAQSLRRRVSEDKIREDIWGQRARLDPSVQVTLLVSSNDPTVLPVAAKCVESPDATLRAAAIETLGRLGGVAEVPVLLQIAGKSGEDARLALSALAHLRDPSVDQALLEQLSKPSPAAAIAVLAQRNSTRSLPGMIKLGAACEDNAVAAELGRAYSSLGTPSDLPELARLLVTAKLPAMRAATASAISSIAIRQNARNEAADVLAPALASAPADLKPVILELLGRVGGTKALAAVLAALPDAATRDAALRALAEWPDDAAAADLLKIASAGEGNSRVIAVRGYLRLAAKHAKERPVPATLDMFKKAVPLADRPDEKRNLLARLAETPATADLLDLALSYLGDASVKSEAAMASLSLADALVKSKPAAARTAAERIRQMAISDTVSRRADQVLGKLQ